MPGELIEPVKRNVSRQVAAMIGLQLLTGARPGEIVQIRPCDIDRTGPTWTYQPAEQRTQHYAHERLIFLGPKAQQVLSPFLLRPDDAHCFSPAEAEEDRRRALSAQRKTPLSCGNVPGSNREAKPRRKANTSYNPTATGERSTTAWSGLSCRRATWRSGKTRQEKEYPARLTKKKAELTEWRRAHHWHLHRLRHNYATNVPRDFDLEGAQILL